MKFSILILLIAAIFWGILLGGVVYSHIAYFPAYLADLPASAVVVNGPYAIHEEYFWITIHPLLLLSLIIALITNWKIKERRSLILIPLVWYAIVLVVSTIYFVPELGHFKNSLASGIPHEEWARRAHTWFICSIIRGISLLIAGVLLFRALTKPERINLQGT